MKPVKLWMLMVAILMALTSPANAASLPDTPPEKPSQWIAAHTAGEISAASKIEVRFTRAMATLDPGGKKSPRPPLSFDPPIQGKTVWVTPRHLEFRPAKRLPSGQAYTATLDFSVLSPAEAPGRRVSTGKAPGFTFDFNVLSQAFDLRIEGLKSVPRKKGRELRLTGYVLTADVAPSHKVLEFLTATQGKRHLRIHWTHHENGRRHTFGIPGIRRGKQASDVTLEWNGRAMGASGGGERRFPVPAMGPFEVLSARAVTGQTQYVEIRFSDPLPDDLNLEGLIRVDRGRRLRFDIDGSLVRVYSAARLSGEVSVRLEQGIRNRLGVPLAKRVTRQVTFDEKLPQVRFVGKGVILPSARDLTIPVETLNLRALIVEAIHVYDENVSQFLQVNAPDGNRELKRVGRPVWKKVVPLAYTPGDEDQWVRHELDVGPLVKNHPGGFYRLELTFRPPHIVHPCGGAAGTPAPAPGDIAPETWDAATETSFWDTYGRDDGDFYYQRFNPCHPGYYRDFYDHNILAARNVLVSNMGLIAKRAPDGTLFAAATDLNTAKPLKGARLTLLDYQQQPIARGKTDRQGAAWFHTDKKPFLLVAERKRQRGYLKLADGAALSVSPFDVAGQAVKKGLKGFIYGERGVWRPGDTLFLTFILLDTENRLPGDHPVQFTLLNPRGQVAHTAQRRTGENGFYTFKVATAPNAPTGNWTARIRVGGATFEKILKVETIMPNRLKIDLGFPDHPRGLARGGIQGELSSAWLHGAPAKHLDAEIKLDFTTGRTFFPKYQEYAFDDPTRRYEPESAVIFKESLDENGRAAVSADIAAENASPGMLSAHFTTRVFEPGGAFSVDRLTLPFHPYERYVGLRVPRGDAARGMLLTDTPHTVRLAALTPDGAPVPGSRVKIRLYKIKWRWWWEKGPEAMADYVGSDAYRPIREETVDLKDGRGTWEFEIKYPAWGRYLVSVQDLDGNHRAGKVVYIDWPGWAGRARKDMPDGASILSFTPDKPGYEVGDTVSIAIPAASKGRGLVSIESGNRILKTDWISATGDATLQYRFKATADMAPNVYAHVMFLQPHSRTANDLPIRLYGVTRIPVTDPRTRLTPRLDTPGTFTPGETATVRVREADGKPMTYTLALVDEGLLDLTRFATPDPWKHFYRTEALGVRTWDLFDLVAGSAGGVGGRLLSVGGDGALDRKGDRRANRFPPMVRFLGPFSLPEGGEHAQAVDIPQYVGSVRAMVVAGQGQAFGSAHRAVPVRKPLMVLGTLPRVVGPGETMAMPVTVFAMDPSVKSVAISLETRGPIRVDGPSEMGISFGAPGDDTLFFRLQAASRPGTARVRLRARSGDAAAEQAIEFNVRVPTTPVTTVIADTLPPGKTWEPDVVFPGMPGTRGATLEVSGIPPMNLTQRLDYLTGYPHGCAEQTTSAAFPQLYLDRLLNLAPARLARIETNVKTGIQRLAALQQADGGFAYWPGQELADDWVSSYAGHFLMEAEKVGYLLPDGMRRNWSRYQSRAAREWEPGAERAELKQAYRLFTLALAGAPEMGAMNRLREQADLPAAARMRLAAAYHLSGQPEAAAELINAGGMDVPDYRELAGTYGSALRDRAMMLETLALTHRLLEARPLAKEIAAELSGPRVLSTQTTAYGLMALAHYAGVTGSGGNTFSFGYTWAGGQEESVSSDHLIAQIPLDIRDGAPDSLKLINTGDRLLYPRLILTGTPPPGRETADENGLSLRVDYLSRDHRPLDPAALDQGTDLVARVTVKNTGNSRYRELALTHLLPSGWEIHNTRMDPAGHAPDSGHNYRDIRDDRIYTYFDLAPGEEKTFSAMVNASYTGRFYLPMVSVAAMYDATIHARVPGRWIRVTRAGQENGG